MGRKPNQLLLEYFERGQKLEDSSNRYQHVCRSCGEHFPKGRIETLVSHLIKKCTSISPQARALAMQRLEDAKRHHETPTFFAGHQVPQTMIPVEAAYRQAPNMSALETLAEVSRRQLHQNPSGGSAQRPAKRQRLTSATELQQMNSSFSEFVVEDPHVQPAPAGEGHDETTSHLLRGLQAYNASEEQSRDGHEPNSRPLDQAKNVEGSHSAAAQPAAPRGDVGDSIDPQLQAEDASSSQPPLQQDASPSKTTTETGPSSRPLFHEFMIISPGADAPKRRGRFTESRRKEVSAIRKQGACLRCRMLKKSCSGDTPCATCDAVNTARLWKTPCIRTKLVDEFDLYQAGVHSALAAARLAEVPFADPRPCTGRLLATHFPGLDIAPACFEVKRAGSPPTAPCRIDSSDTSQNALVDYMSSTAHAFIEHEPVTLVRETLLAARSLAEETRDTTLAMTVELWTANQCLVDPQAVWNLSTCAAQGQVRPTKEAMPLDEHDPRHSLYLRQLASHVETLCARHTRTIANELERRLIQRQQAASQHLATFLMSILLLNCCERLCWRFSTWNEPWPLQKPATAMLQQAERMTDVLSSVLVIRGVLPSTVANAEGLLCLGGDDNKDEKAAAWLAAACINVHELENKVAGRIGEGPRGWDGHWLGRLLLPSSND